MIKLDLSQDGLAMVFRPHEVVIVEALFTETEKLGFSTREMYEHLLSKIEPATKSRATVIFFLDRLVKLGVCSATDHTGKGGHHKRYYAKMSREDFWMWVANMAATKIHEASGMNWQELLL